MQHMRISDQKDHAEKMAHYQEKRQQIENDLLAEQLRARHLENCAREMCLIERAIAAGVNPAIFNFNKIAQSR